MNPYIAKFGRNGCEIVYASDLDAAYAKARMFALADGMSVEQSHDPDEVDVRPFDEHVARDWGLMWLDEAEQHWDVKEART